MSEPFAFTSGPHDARIAIVGEAWGESEDRVRKPFVGSSGAELRRMLLQADIKMYDCLLTNVFQFRPPNNNLDHLCGQKKDVGADYGLPALGMGKYILPIHFPHVFRLAEELKTCQPNLVIALGNTACWAILRATAISAIRGAITEARLVPGLKVLPTYHPAAVLRNWSLRSICVADFLKARREAEFPEIRRPARSILTSPTLDNISHWFTTEAVHAEVIGADIETERKQMTMIGFATRPGHAMVIPFVDHSKPDHCYWPTPEAECLARQWVQRILALPCPKVGQNFLYDLMYLIREGFRPRNCAEDTMLLSHSLWPEMPKGLGFLGSVHTQESAWKLLRHHQQDAEKRDE